MRRVPGHPGLYREDVGDEGTRYRIVISRGGKKTQEYFYFGAKRSEADARAAAIRRWREIRDSSPVITRRAFAQIERRKSPSGVVGVRRITSEVKGHPYDFWIAVFSDQRSNKRMRSFSVNKYGEDKAKELALKARREALEQMETR